MKSMQGQWDNYKPLEMCAFKFFPNKHLKQHDQKFELKDRCLPISSISYSSTA